MMRAQRRHRLVVTLGALALALVVAPQHALAETGPDGQDAGRIPATPATGAPAPIVWVPGGEFAASALIRVPRHLARLPDVSHPPNLRLSSVRNERVSAQLVVADRKGIRALHAGVSALTTASGAIIPASDVEVRYVGYVPVEAKSPKVGGATFAEVDGMSISGVGVHRVVADPLWVRAAIDVPARAAQPVWFTFRIPATTPPGTYRGYVFVASGPTIVWRASLELTVDNPVLPDPGQGAVRLNAWFNPNAVALAYGIQPWSAAHWAWLKRYFTFLARAGQRTILTTIVQYPWRVAWNDWKPQTAAGYDSMVQWRYDGSHWQFDYTRFDRYVRSALAAGLGPDIAAYSVLAFRGPQRLAWLDTRTGHTQARTLKVTSPFWRKAWCAFMHDFSAHLERNGWLAHTWLGFDERPASIIKPAMQMLHACAPSLAQRTLMAGTQHIARYATNLSLGLDSLHTVSDAWIGKRRAAGRLTTFYVWAGDAHPNTLTFSPAVESRMMGWIVARRHLDGYLHWAVDDWTRDVFRDPVFAFSQGDEYLIYPGPDGPVSSIRWELLRDGMQDAELVAMARKKRPDSKLLQQALKLATRHPDGRDKDVRDITRAHAMVVSVLTAGH